MTATNGETGVTTVANGQPCRILSLDGGGAKGFYTLGVLAQVEAMLKGKLLCDQFDLIFGTSTGAIIAALLSLGTKSETYTPSYVVPGSCGSSGRKRRSRHHRILLQSAAIPRAAG